MATAVEELLGLLKAAAGEPNGSLHSHLGKWRQRVSELVGSGGGGGPPTPSTPQALDQVVYSEASGGQTVVSGDDVVFDQVDISRGTLPYDTTTGVWTLTAGQMYRLTAHFTAVNFTAGETQNLGIQWVDAITEVPLHPQESAFLTPGTNTNDLAENPTTDIFYLAAAAQGVKLKVTALTAGAATLAGGLSTALVQEVR
jgi:hypothetical protein